MHSIVFGLVLLAAPAQHAVNQTWLEQIQIVLRVLTPPETRDDKPPPPRRPEEHPVLGEWRGVPRELGPPPRRPPEHPVFGDWRGPKEDPPGSPHLP